MVMLVVSTIFVLTSAMLAFRADARFRDERRIPMQWGFGGAVTWSAPRRPGLALMPMLAVILLGVQTFLATYVPPREGQEGFVLPVLLGTGVLLLAVQCLHFRLIRNTLRRNGE